MTVNFLFVANDKYASNLGICTFSVMYNMCPVADKVRCFILNCGITEKNKSRLRRQAAGFENAEIIFYNIEQKLKEVVPKVPVRWNPAIYGRLFLTELLPLYEGLERLIYLDCDVLMDRPVTELFTMPLEGKCIAGVADSECLQRKRALGIEPDKPYINSGVMVIDTARWVELDASARVIACINSFPEQLFYPDQDAINYVLHDEIMLLEPKYNMLWMICDRDVPIMLKYSEDYAYNAEQTYYALYHGSIYHYAGHDMWSIYGITPVHSRILDKYIGLSDWRDKKRRFGSVRNFILWLMVETKRLLIGEGRLTDRRMRENAD